MDCLHGIRVLSTFYVVIGHTYAMYAMSPMSNLTYIMTVITKFKPELLNNVGKILFYLFFQYLVGQGLLKHDYYDSSYCC